MNTAQLFPVLAAFVVLFAGRALVARVGILKPFNMRGRSADTAGVSRANELRGVTIPVHPGVGQKTQ